MRAHTSHTPSAPPYYAKPKAVGGRLIREVIGFLRENQVELPITSHILIAVSGGPDSTALAHLLLKYGRRIAPKSHLALIHINHGWRGKASDADARFVRRLAKEFKVPCFVRKFTPPEAGDPRSWEDVAREQRKAAFEQVAAPHQAIVLTAHQADDLAETVLWRLCTGSAGTHGGGIAVRHGRELRPLLRIRKQDLLDYLQEEGQSWCEDETNFGGRFLRSRIRMELMPVLQSVFPKAAEHLAKLGLEAQQRNPDEVGEVSPELLLGVAGIRTKRAHWKSILTWAEGRKRSLDLPGGWTLTRENGRAVSATQKARPERWVLEKREEKA